MWKLEHWQKQWLCWYWHLCSIFKHNSARRSSGRCCDWSYRTTKNMECYRFCCCTSSHCCYFFLLLLHLLAKSSAPAARADLAIAFETPPIPPFVHLSQIDIFLHHLSQVDIFCIILIRSILLFVLYEAINWDLRISPSSPDPLKFSHHMVEQDISAQIECFFINSLVFLCCLILIWLNLIGPPIKTKSLCLVSALQMIMHYIINYIMRKDSPRTRGVRGYHRSWWQSSGWCRYNGHRPYVLILNNYASISKHPPSIAIFWSDQCRSQ